MTLKGKHILVTAGPTHEPIDPVRVIANRSSGRQGFAIAKAAAEAGARVTLIAGPVSLDTPRGIDRVDVESAVEMQVRSRPLFPPTPRSWLPLWLTGGSIRHRPNSRKAPARPSFTSGPTPIFWRSWPRASAGQACSWALPQKRTMSSSTPAKRTAKGADWIVANDVSGDVMGGHRNRVHLITAAGVEDWPEESKEEVARRLIERIASALS